MGRYTHLLTPCVCVFVSLFLFGLFMLCCVYINIKLLCLRCVAIYLWFLFCFVFLMQFLFGFLCIYQFNLCACACACVLKCVSSVHTHMHINTTHACIQNLLTAQSAPSRFSTSSHTLSLSFPPFHCLSLCVSVSLCHFVTSSLLLPLCQSIVKKKPFFKYL